MKFKNNKKKIIIFLSFFLGLSIVFGTIVSIKPTTPASHYENVQIPTVSSSEKKEITYWWYEDPYFTLALIFGEDDDDEDGLLNYQEILVVGTNPWDPDTDGDGMWDGYEYLCGIWNSGWQDPLVYNERYAILIAGGYDNSASNYDWYWNHLISMYDNLILGYNYKPENVYVFYCDGNPPNEDNMAEERLQNIDEEMIEPYIDMIDYDTRAETIINFLAYGELKENIKSDDLLFFWTSCHGDKNEVWINSTTRKPFSYLKTWDEYTTFLYDRELTFLLSGFEYAQIIFSIDSCKSGGFLDPGELGPDADTFQYDTNTLNLNDLPGNVIVMTCTDVDDSMTGRTEGYGYNLIKAIRPMGWAPTWWLENLFSTSYILLALTAFKSLNIVLTGMGPSWEALMKGEALYYMGATTLDTADENEDNAISMREAFIYAKYNNDYGKIVTGDPEDDKPQWYESSPGLMARTFL